MKKKIWIGIGAFVFAGSGMAAADLPKASVDAANGSAKQHLLSSAANMILAQTQGGEGEGGEGAEGGEGGEGGIDVAATENDPVEYNIALQVIAAHYYAGLAAYEAKQQEAGAQMFAHGLSEVYVAMEDVFKRRGVNDLGKALEAAVEAATANKPVKDVQARVRDVLKALAAAEQAGPKFNGAAMAIKAKVVGDMVHRAAAQYETVVKDPKNLESYLDGLGFATAALKESGKVLPWLRKTDRKKAATVEAALKMTKAAYPGIKVPKAKVSTEKLLAGASAAQLAVSNL
jgi:hypothetical protein